MRLGQSDLTGWNFSTQNLTGAVFYNAALANADFSNSNLTNVLFQDSTLTGANLTGASIRGANFTSATDAGFTATQLYSTASYQTGDLTKIDFSFNDLSGWDFSGKNLADASFRNATLTGTNFTGADARGANNINTGASIHQNLIHPDGHVEGLDIAAGETMRLWDYNLETPIAIVVEEGMAIDDLGTLRAVLEDDQWGSTLSFESGVPVSLGGTLELLLDAKVNPVVLAGTTFQLFDWSGVSPGGTFDEIAFEPDTTWDTSQLYTTGEVTLLSAAGLSGDFNGDGVVNLADYTVWRNNLGAASDTPINNAGDDQPGVNTGDYAVWKDNFGSGGGPPWAVPATVPEPGTCSLVVIGVIGAWAARRSIRSVLSKP